MIHILHSPFLIITVSDDLKCSKLIIAHQKYLILSLLKQRSLQTFPGVTSRLDLGSVLWKIQHPWVPTWHTFTCIEMAPLALHICIYIYMEDKSREMSYYSRYCEMSEFSGRYYEMSAFSCRVGSSNDIRPRKSRHDPPGDNEGW